jgi:hypothetical protein
LQKPSGWKNCHLGRTGAARQSQGWLEATFRRSAREQSARFSSAEIALDGRADDVVREGGEAKNWRPMQKNLKK